LAEHGAADVELLVDLGLRHVEARADLLGHLGLAEVGGAVERPGHGLGGDVLAHGVHGALHLVEVGGDVDRDHLRRITIRNPLPSACRSRSRPFHSEPSWTNV
jgi:hypothetical protein